MIRLIRPVKPVRPVCVDQGVKTPHFLHPPIDEGFNVAGLQWEWPHRVLPADRAVAAAATTVAPLSMNARASPRPITVDAPTTSVR
jgi:hypothetical protein